MGRDTDAVLRAAGDLAASDNGTGTISCEGQSLDADMQSYTCLQIQHPLLQVLLVNTVCYFKLLFSSLPSFYLLHMNYIFTIYLPNTVTAPFPSQRREVPRLLPDRCHNERLCC